MRKISVTNKALDKIESGCVICAGDCSLSAYANEEMDDEQVLIHQISRAIEKKLAEHNFIGVDVASFEMQGYNFSYIYAVFNDAICDIEQKMQNDIDRITFFNAKGNMESIEAGESYFMRPYTEEKNQLFGDLGDPLKDRFEKYASRVGTKPFYAYLRDLLIQKGFTARSEVYKASGISKFTFSKLMNYKLEHRPSKDTLAALVIGLKLNIDEAEELYNQAGYHLGNSDFVDKVVSFFIQEKIYDIDEVNYCLLYYGYPPLGEKPRTNTKVEIDTDFE